MTAHYEGARARRLHANERGTGSQRPDMPLVLEPQGGRSLSDLCALLGRHSTDIVADLAEHGAILLRGFDLRTSHDFERAVLSIQGMKGMASAFNSEPGRVVVDDTKYVLHTNTLYKTGGGWFIGGFHTENHYVADVPRFISFFCLRPSRQGGETGLLDTAGLYRELPPELQHALQERRYAVGGFVPLAQLDQRYGVGVERLEQLARERGFDVAERGGERCLAFHKPFVARHPLSGELSLMCNLSGELGSIGLARELHKAFLPDYRGLRWLPHRALWRAVLTLDAVLHPRTAWPALDALLQRLQREPKREPVDAKWLRNVASSRHMSRVARSLRKNFACFRWQTGDLLLIDNIRVAHSGMPGFGARELRALIATPIDMPLSPQGPGVFDAAPSERPTLSVALEQQRHSSVATSHSAGGEAGHAAARD